MALEVAAPHKEQLPLLFSWPLVPFTVALVMCPRNAKPGLVPQPKRELAPPSRSRLTRMLLSRSRLA